MAFPSAGLQLILQGASQFQSGLASSGKAVTNFTGSLGGSATNAVISFTRALGNMAIVAGGIILAKLGQEVVDLGREVVTLTIAYERQRTTLQGLLAVEAIREGTVKDMTEALRAASPVAADLFRQYERLAILSPFKSSDIINARQQLQIYGVTSQELDRLVPRLVDVGSLFGWSSEKMNLAALALGQIETKGKLTGEEVRQLANVGIPAIAAVADALGITNAEAQKLVTKGSISAAQFFEVFMKWSDPATGSAERFAKTLPGLMSSLGDLREIALRELGKGFFDTQLTSLDEFVQALKGFVMPKQQTPDQVGGVPGDIGTSPLQELGRQFGETFNKVKEAVQSTLTFIKPFTDWVQVAVPTAMQVAADRWNDTLKPALEAFANWIRSDGIPTLQELGLWIGTEVPKASNSAAQLWESTLLPAFKSVATYVKQNVFPVLSDLQGWFNEKLAPALADLTAAFNRALGPALEMTSAILTVTLVPALKVLWAFISGFVWPILKTLAETLGNQVIRAIQDTTTKLNQFTDSWNTWKSVGSAAASWLMTFYSWLTGTWNSGVQNATKIIGALSSGFSVLRDDVSDVIDKIRDFVDAVSNIHIPTLSIDIDWPSPPDWYCDLFGCSPKPPPMHQKVFIDPVYTPPKTLGGGMYSGPIGVAEAQARTSTSYAYAYTNAPQYTLNNYGQSPGAIRDFGLLRSLESGR